MQRVTHAKKKNQSWPLTLMSLFMMYQRGGLNEDRSRWSEDTYKNKINWKLEKKGEFVILVGVQSYSIRPP